MPSLRRGRRNLARIDELAKAMADEQPDVPLSYRKTVNYRRRMLVEDALIQELHARGLRTAEIAKLLGKAHRTVRRRLEMAKVTRGLLESMLVDFAHDWKQASKAAALQGDHRPAMDAIAAVTDIQVVKKVAGGEGPKYQLQIGINLAGQEPRAILAPVEPPP